MATHPGILSWRSPWTEEPGGIWSMVITESQTGLSAWAPSAPQGLSQLYLILPSLQLLSRAFLLFHNKVLYFHCSSYQNVSKFKPGVRGDLLGPRPPPGGRMRKRSQKTPLTPLATPMALLHHHCVFPWPSFSLTCLLQKTREGRGKNTPQ